MKTNLAVKEKSFILPLSIILYSFFGDNSFDQFSTREVEVPLEPGIQSSRSIEPIS